MSKIEIKINHTKSANNQIKQLSSKLTDTKISLSMIRSHVDSKVVQRRNIGQRMDDAVARMNASEKKLQKLYQFIDHSMDLYIKAEKKVQSLKLGEIEKKSIWDTAKESVKGFGKGLGTAVVSTVEGIWHAITHPVETIKGTIHVITHPVETGKAIWKAISDSWKKDVVNGDAESRSKWFGRAFGEVALAIVGTKGVDKGVKLLKGSEVLKGEAGIRIISNEAGSKKVIQGTYVNEILQKSTCSNLELYKYLKSMDKNMAETFLETGKWPEAIQVPKDPSVLTLNGRIDWAQVPNDGFKIDITGSPIKEPHFPKKGEQIDRYGPSDGRFTSPIVDGKPYSYDQRSLPYIEDVSKYHQYEIKSDFSDIQRYYENSTNIQLKNDIKAYMDVYGLTFEDLVIQKGEIAPGFGSLGGGIQYQLPLPTSMLEELGLLKELK